MKRIFALILALLIATCVPLTASAETAIDTTGYGKVYELLTSNDPDNYTRITASGDELRLEGKYTDWGIKDIQLLRSLSKGESVAYTLNGDGSFTCVISGKPQTNMGYVYLKFDNNINIYFVAMYEEGWFLPDNGNADKAAALIEAAAEISPAAAVNYLSATLDPEEAAATLDRIKAIADEVTAGATSDYDKAFLLSQYVSKNYYYDRDARDNSVTVENIALTNVLSSHKTVCSGFANLYSAFLQAVGIKAVNIKGGATSSGITYERLLSETAVHEWVCFYSEELGRWVNTDACWDGHNRFEGGAYTNGVTCKLYFDMPSLTFSDTHRADTAEYRTFSRAGEYIPQENAVTQGINSSDEDNEDNAVTVTDSNKSSESGYNESGNDNLLISAVITLSVLVLALIAFVVIMLTKRA